MSLREFGMRRWHYSSKTGKLRVVKNSDLVEALERRILFLKGFAVGILFTIVCLAVAIAIDQHFLDVIIK